MLSSEGLEVEAWIVGIAGEEEEKEEVLLTLHGDFFSAHVKSANAVHVVKFHITFLQHELARRSHSLETSAEELAQDGYSVEKLLARYCEQVLKLVRYRDHVVAEENWYQVVQAHLSPEEAAEAFDVQQPARPPPSVAVEMETADGRFLALAKRCTKKEAEWYSNQLHVAEHCGRGPSKGESLSYECVTQVRGVFPDRLVLKLDIASLLVYVLLPDGEDCVFSLSDFQHSEGIFAHQGTGAHNLGVRGWVERITTCVRQSLAFYRWAVQPADLREELVRRDQETARIARAAAMQAHRHLMVHKLASKQITPQQACAQSQQFEATLSDSSGPPSQGSPGSRGPRPTAGGYTPVRPMSASLGTLGGTLGSQDVRAHVSAHVVSPQLSSISSYISSSATPMFAPGQAHVVTPDALSIGEQADREVGEYLFKNVRYSSTNNSFGAYRDKQPLYPDAANAGPGPLDTELATAYRKQEEMLAWGGAEKQFAAELLGNAPRPDIVPCAARFLSATYVQSALEQASRTVGSNAEYLERMRSKSVR